MAAFHVDRRDLDFVLLEQLDFSELLTWPRYQEMNHETVSLVLAEASRMAYEVLAPINAPMDRKPSWLENGRVVVPDVMRPAYAQFSADGWTAMHHDVDHGGMGLPYTVAMAINEMFMGASNSFMFLPGLTGEAGHLLESYGSPRLQALVPRLYSGEWTGTMCLTEPQAGTSVGDLRTTATPIEGDRYLIKGNKIFISCGDHDLTENIIHLVLARVPGDAAGTRGISLFAVPKYRFDDQGKIGASNDVTVSGIEHKMGIKACPTCALSFGENDQCEGYLIGERQSGLVYMFQMMNGARLYCGLQGAACANVSYQMALEYAKERVQGVRVGHDEAGPTTIINHPDVRRNLMLSKAYAEGLRALLIKTSYYADVAAHHPDAERRQRCQELLDLLTPVCKAYATDIGFKVTELAMQIHGGYGYIQDYNVEQYMRDVKIASLYEGTNGVQALDLLGRKMRLKGGSLFMNWVMITNEFFEAHRGHARLSKIIEQAENAKNTLVNLAMALPAIGKSDPELVLLGATPFLELFGHVQVGILLLEQALIADRALENKKLAEDHADTRFYRGKIQTAQFFLRTVTPHVQALAEEIQSPDRSALEIAL